MGGVACILMGIVSACIPAVMHIEDNHKDTRAVQTGTASTGGTPAASPGE